MLRDPVNRTLSEFLTTSVGWPQRDRLHNVKGDRYCNNNTLVPFDAKANCLAVMRPLSNRAQHVRLDAWLNCAHNQAFDRMTLTLARSVCRGDASEHDQQRLLTSAKQQLEALAFFGLLEHAELSLALFEATFGVRFRSSPLAPLPRRLGRASGALWQNATARATIARHNRLDAQLYAFATDLFYRRVRQQLPHATIIALDS
jgi:hypothetical protein